MQEGDTVDSLFKRAAYNYLPKTERMDALGGRILDYVNKGWFMFSSPVLSNAPKDRRSPTPHMPISCFVGDTKIITRDGHKEIRFIKEGDLVLTHKGRFRKVLATKTSESSDMYNLKVGRQSLTVTGNHLIMTNYGWVRVDNLARNYHLVACDGFLSDVTTSPYTIKIANKPDISENGRFTRTEINESVEVTPELSWALGFWFAEGSTNDNGMIAVCNQSEKLLTRWGRAMFDAFNVNKYTVHPCKGRNWKTAAVCSQTLREWFDTTFGKGCKVKTLPDWVLELPDECLKEFYDGIYAGDGSKTTSHKQIELSNTKLIAQLHLILMKLKIVHTCQLNKVIKYTSSLGKEVVVENGVISEPQPFSSLSKNHNSLHKGILLNGVLYKSITHINKLDVTETVYDIEVEEDHSFSANTVHAHNCFIMDLPDEIKGQIEANQEMAALSVSGGGIGMNSEIRAVSKKAPGAIPYLKTVDSAIGYYKQAGSRRGSCAIYMEASHPDIVEFIKIRIPAGDSARKIENRKQVNNAVIVTDAFRDAVLQDLPWELKCPATGEVREILRARHLWETILDTRALTGEPYIFFKDRANDSLPQTLKDKGLEIKSSNLCVAPETSILTKQGEIPIRMLEGMNVEVWNGVEWSDVKVVCTSENSELVRVWLYNPATEMHAQIECTREHKFDVATGWKDEMLPAQQLCVGHKLVPFALPDGEIQQWEVKEVEVTGRMSPTFCFTEPKRNRGVFNGILTGQCTEITIPTDRDRTAVCCLSSLNVEYFDEWKSTTIVEDAIEFLDCILQYFIDFADPKYLSKAIYSATMGRDLGLGAMGFHYYLQKNGIPFESGGFGSAVQANHKIFSFIEKKAIEKSIALGNELGHAPDLLGGTELRRNVNLLAIAPNSNSGIILQTSPSIDPLARNSFAQTTRAGTYQVRNKYFQRLLDDKDLPPDEQEAIWKSVDKSHGSVQHLEFLSDEEKSVFKTAYEIDQHWVVQHAEDRAPYLTQAQPVNLFFTAGTDKSYFNSVHLKALKSKTLKTLYYCRMERAQAASHTNAHINAKKITDWSVEECISCSG